jgi:hypothetical protein
MNLSPDERFRIVREFFHAHPGTHSGPPGLGMAVLDFMGWLVGSGRMAEEGGSPWWRTLNGSLVLDLAGDTPGTPGVDAWQRYASATSAVSTVADTRHAELQALFWEAHQTSLHSVLPACEDMLAAESRHERSFVEIAMRVVDLSARHNQPTHTPVLGESTRKLYPDHYPLAAPCNGALHALAVELGVTV